MNARHLAVLVLAAIVAVSAAFYSTSLRDSAGNNDPDAMLVPELKSKLNDIAEVRIVKAGGATVATLRRGESQWRVVEHSNYAADTGKIRKLLLSLADARLREAKTTNPDNFHYLGLQDVENQDAGGVRIDLGGIKPPVALIVGNSAGDVGDATYARAAGSHDSWLVSGRIDVARQAADWLDKSIVDLPAERIQSITITHPDGDSLRLARSSRDVADFVVEDMPTGRELTSPGALKPLGTVLQKLTFDDVQATGEFEMVSPTISEYRTFNGLVLTIRSESAPDNTAMVAIAATFDEAQAQKFVREATDFVPVSDGQQTNGAEEVVAAEMAPPSHAVAIDEAQALDAKLSPWVFRIPSHKYQQMTRRLNALLKAEQEGAE